MKERCVGWPRTKGNWWEQQSVSGTWRLSLLFPEGSSLIPPAPAKRSLRGWILRYLKSPHPQSWFFPSCTGQETQPRAKADCLESDSRDGAVLPSAVVPAHGLPAGGDAPNPGTGCGGASPSASLPAAVPSLSFQGQQTPLAVIPCALQSLLLLTRYVLKEKG